MSWWKNLVTEMLCSLRFPCHVGPLWALLPGCRLACWYVCYCEFWGSPCVHWQKAHLGLLSAMSRHLNDVLDSSKKITNHSEIINLTYSFQSFTTKCTVFISGHVYIVITITEWDLFFINFWVRISTEFE